ncbi:unnamed protein product [Periconia digitata]|uniref:Uncharacterized protein n=1 Tax=Periconia digitata TaxID=1303443 RepID=A0A9W4U6F5_9PLEO|nr:unnamed protein product [Periconia digitata]
MPEAIRNHKSLEHATPRGGRRKVPFDTRNVVITTIHSTTATSTKKTPFMNPHHERKSRILRKSIHPDGELICKKEKDHRCNAQSLPKSKLAIRLDAMLYGVRVVDLCGSSPQPEPKANPLLFSSLVPSPFSLLFLFHLFFRLSQAIVRVGLSDEGKKFTPGCVGCWG